MVTRNIAKSGEVRNWGVFSPFQLHLGLIANHSQPASCHIAIRYGQGKRKHAFQYKQLTNGKNKIK